MNEDLRERALGFADSVSARRAALPASAPSGGNVEELTAAQCWTYLRAEAFGRLALDSVDGMPDVFPLNYLVRGDEIFIRSAPGTKMRSIAVNPQVALEIDGEGEGRRWSVVVHGSATRLDADEDIEASGVLGLESASPTGKHNFVRVSVRDISGRRFQSSVPSSRPDVESRTGVTDTARDRAQLRVAACSSRTHGKPNPIPHFEPITHL